MVAHNRYSVEVEVGHKLNVVVAVAVVVALIVD